MDRRTFLKATGGLAAGTALSPAMLRAATSQVKHIVVAMMENRSFDHFLGWLPNANGKQAGLEYVDASGVSHPTHELAPEWTGCGYNDPDHSYDGGRIEIDNGLMDGFMKTSTADVFAIGYFGEGDNKFFPKFATNFTACDMYFPSILGPTFPNRIFQLCGQTDRLDDSVSLCSYPTIFDHCSAAGVSSKYYYGNVPFLTLFPIDAIEYANSFSDFLSDCANGTLPEVSFVDPSFTLLLNTANDNHPQSDIRNGDAFIAQVYQAVTTGPGWANTVLVLNYDEWGGFFEHVPPPRALAPNNTDPDLVNGEALLGCRVPCIVASPWTAGAPANPTVNHTVFDHTSVLKMIESVFNVQPLAARETSNTVGNLLSVINFNRQPRSAPVLPTPQPVTPQKICPSSINPGGGLTRPDDEPNSFRRLEQAALRRGWKVYP
ncbi:MAG TPA: alkaline phosphatase family protein [Bryobacteraceae bacterium]|jgi:phospholipase C|nr:alkaline phosphatase family protein [Bryobacteraceae bacterium]